MPFESRNSEFRVWSDTAAATIHLTAYTESILSSSVSSAESIHSHRHTPAETPGTSLHAAVCRVNGSETSVLRDRAPMYASTVRLDP